MKSLSVKRKLARSGRLSTSRLLLTLRELLNSYRLRTVISRTRSLSLRDKSELSEMEQWKDRCMEVFNIKFLISRVAGILTG